MYLKYESTGWNPIFIILDELVFETITFLSKPFYTDLTLEEFSLAFRICTFDWLRDLAGNEIIFPTVQGSKISVYYISKVISIYMPYRKYLIEQLKQASEINAKL